MNNYKLPDFCNYVMGQSPSSQFYNSNREGLPFLQGCTTFGRMFPTFDTWTTQYTRTCKPNDVLMSVRAPVGDLNISRDVIALGRGVAALSMKQGDNRYLFYLLMANRQKLSSCSTGTIYESISKTQLENIVFDVHEPEEQRHIVDILGSIDNYIENNEEQINKINALAMSFVKKGDNPHAELKPYIKFIKGKKPIENGSTTAPYLSIEAITSFRYESVYSDYMIMATPFDILMVMDGASSGTVFSHQAGVVSSTIAKIDCSDNIKDYLYWYLLSLKEIIKSRNTGSAIPHANKEYISSLKFDYGFATDIKTINILHSLRTRIIQLQEENKKLQELKWLYLKKFFE